LDLPLRIVNASVAFDVSSLRTTSAVRRGLVVVLCLVGGYLLADTEAGINAATAALLVGLLDKGGSPRATWHAMAAQTLLLALVTVVAGLVSGSSVGVLGLMALLAFLAGVSFGVDARAPQVFLYGALQVATYLIAPLSPEKSLLAASGILIAGGLQTLATVLASPVIADLPERRKMILALDTTAALARSIAIGSTRAQKLSAEASAAVAAADQFLSKSDLVSDTRRHYAALLANVDLVRLEGRAFLARQRMGLHAAADPLTRAAFADASRVLEAASRSVRRTRQPSLVDIWAANEELRDQPSQTISRVTSKTAIALADGLSDIEENVESAIGSSHVRRTHRHQKLSFRERIRRSIRWGSRPLWHGCRMAAAAVVGELLGQALHLEHSSWVAVTAMMLLRPDVGPTIVRVLTRAIGTTLGVALIIPVAAVCGNSILWLSIAVGIAAVVTYSLVAVNYASQVGLLTTTIVLMLSLRGTDPTELAVARWQDVLIGCLVGVTFAFVFPLWNRGSLAEDAASYARAAADWLDSIGSAARLTVQGTTTRQTDSTFTENQNTNNHDDPLLNAEMDRWATGDLGELGGAGKSEQMHPMVLAMRQRGEQTREARLKAAATLSAALLEPPSRSVTASAIGGVLNAVARCGDAGIASEVLLRHGHVTTALGADNAEQAAEELHRVAEILATMADPSAPKASGMHDAPHAVKGEDLMDTAQIPTDRVGALLSQAADSAGTALRLTHQLFSPTP